MANSSPIVAKLKKWWREVYLFLFSFYFLKHLVGMVAFLLILLFCTSWWMRCYTNHGESLQVHDYIGLELDDAARKAKSRSFSIVVADSVFIIGKAPNQVIEQDPKPLSRVKENRKIYLTVTKAEADLVPLPDIYSSNDDYQTYRSKLRKLNVKVEIIGREFRSRMEENTILEVVFEGDTITELLEEVYRVPKGSTVGVIVTEKGGGSVPLPDLVCQKYDAARFVIGNYNLNIGSVVKDATVTDLSTAYVWKQSPRYRPEGSLRIGEQVDIFLTQHRPDRCGGSEFNIEDPPGRGRQQPHLSPATPRRKRRIGGV